eukprot:s3996_g4.t1
MQIARHRPSFPSNPKGGWQHKDWKKRGIEVIPTLSKPSDDWSGRTGYVQDVLQEDESRGEGSGLGVQGLCARPQQQCRTVCQDRIVVLRKVLQKLRMSRHWALHMLGRFGLYRELLQQMVMISKV